MGSAIGGGTNTRIPHGPLWFDVRDYGAVSSTVTDSWAAIQGAIDAANSAMTAANQNRATVFLPTGIYTVRRPLIMDQSGIELVGESWGTCLNASNDFPTLMIGMERTLRAGQNTHTLDATYRPDAYGVLDSTADIGPGTRHGFRTQKNAFLGFQGTGFDCGMPDIITKRVDRWAKTQQLTIDMMLTPGDLTQLTIPTTSGTILGMGQTFVESPFMLVAGDDGFGNTNLQFRFRTGDQPDWSTNGTYTFTFPLCGSNHGVTTVNPPWRITIQVDLVNARYTVWLNGVQLALTGVNVPSAGKFFKINYHCPFTVLAGGSIALPFLLSPNTYPDLGLYGLHVSNIARYAVGTTGSAQVKIGGGSPTDATRYIRPDANTLGMLQMSDVASGEAAKLAYRSIAVTCTTSTYAQTAMGWFYSYAPGDGLGFNRVKNLRINGPSGANKLYGYGIMVGATVDTYIEDCHVTSNGYALGTPNLEANYVQHVTRCQLFGGDSCFYGYSTEAVLIDNTFGSAGNFTVKACGSDLTIRDSFFKDYDNSSYCVFAFFAGNYDSDYLIDQFFVDSESGGFARAMILAQGAGYTGTTLTVKNGKPINTAPGVLFELQDCGSIGNTWQPSRVNVSGLRSASGGPILKLNGPGWSGTIETYAQSLGPRVIHTGTFGKGCNVQVIDRINLRYYDTSYPPVVGPPTEGSFISGGHRLLVSAPLPGQYSEWRCTASGSIGTTTPPAFRGINPIDCDFGVLTAYAATNDTITGTLT